MITALRRKLESRYLEELGFASGKAFTREICGSVKSGSVFLDAGCGEGRLRRLLPNGVQYIGIDRFEGKDCEGYGGWSHKPTIIADLHEIPLKDASCDAAVLLHVLEHVRSPGTVLAEVTRVMKPGAKVFISVPFVHEVHHAPNDHFRFTRYALEDLLRSTGLTPLSIKPSGGYFRALSHVLGQFRPLYREQSAAVKVMLSPLFALASLLRLIVKLFEYPLDLLDRRQLLTCGYLCTAVKEGQE